MTKARLDSEEIVVTPEMVKAGVDILMQFDWGWSDPNTYTADIFRAMASVSRRDGRSASVPSR